MAMAEPAVVFHRAAAFSSASVICTLVCTCLKVCSNTLSLFLAYPNTPHWKCVSAGLLDFPTL